MVTVKRWSTSEEKEINLMRKPVSSLPKAVPESFLAPDVPLTKARQWYLYDHLRSFCMTEQKMDELSPLPTVSWPSSEEAQVYRVKGKDRTKSQEDEMEVEGGFRINIPNECNDVNPETDVESTLEVRNDHPSNEQAEDQEREDDSGIPETHQSVEEIDIPEAMDVEVMAESSIKPQDKQNGCGNCEKCFLFIDYLSGARSKNYHGIPRNQRFKCGQCMRRNQRKSCKNVTCSN